MNKLASKSLHESFSKFFENPTRESLRTFLRDHVGELRNCDFKESWPDNGPIAKHILGIANVGGGCLIIGVKEQEDGSLAPAGVAALHDKADIISAIKIYLPEPLLNSIEIADFSYSAAEYQALVGKRFQVLFVQSDLEALPFIAQRAGVGLRSGGIYIRKEGATEEANYEEVQRLLRGRLTVSAQTATAQDLKAHLEELKVLYKEIPRNIQTGAPPIASVEWVQSFTKFASMFVGEAEANPMYPAEDYQVFIARVLEGKKRLIERALGLPK